MKQITKLPLFLAALFAANTFANAQRSATPPEQIRLAEGFQIELIYSVPRDDKGSWVAMCQDDKGRLIVSDQYGGLYRFPVPKPGKKVDPAAIEQITYSADSSWRSRNGLGCLSLQGIGPQGLEDSDLGG
jgi:hypothetical protein